MAPVWARSLETQAQSPSQVTADQVTIAVCSQHMHRSLKRSGRLHRLQCQFPQLDQRLLLWNGHLHYCTVYSGKGRGLRLLLNLLLANVLAKLFSVAAKCLGMTVLTATCSKKLIKYITLYVPGMLLHQMALDCSLAGAASAQLSKVGSVALD